MNHLRVQVVKTTRTDLLCIACGTFGVRGGSPMLAIVAPEQPSDNAHAGVHRACIYKIKARRAHKAPSQPRPLPSGEA